MTAAIQPSEWLRFIDREYLANFVSDGGSSIKFAVPVEESLRPDLFTGLADLAGQAGYLVVAIDSGETKIHMMDEIYFRAARQVPWQILSRKVIARLASQSGYSWPEDSDSEVPLYEQIAARSNVDAQMVLVDLKKAIWTRVFNRPDLVKDFRSAMTHLCMAELSGGQEGATQIQVLTGWLTGQNKAVSAVKPYGIFRKINRATARYFFESMLHWLRFAGYTGTAILVDARRLMLARNPKDENVYYSKAAVFDSYEVLREFIDAADRMEGCFIAVIPDMAFLEDPGRGINTYEALKFRVFDEVRDRNLVNPMASLVRISAAPQGNLL